MAQEVIIELKAETQAAKKQIEALTNEVSELRKEQAAQSKEALDQAKETSKGVGLISKSFKGLGTALKAAGIGLAVAAFQQLREIFMQNQKAVDFFNTAFEAVSLAFNDFVDFLLNNTGGIVDTFQAIFENPLEGIKNLGKTIYDGVVVRFEQLVEVLGLAGKAIGQLVKGEFSAAFDTIKEAGKQTVDVITGVDDSFDETVESIKNYTKETIKTAAANVQLANNAELAAAQQSRLVEQYDRQAEQLRQIRDDERFSIEERRKANDDLLQVLAEQEAAMLKQADAQVASAQADLAKNNSIENQIALTDALANKEGVLAQIEGLRSEQKANDLALDREETELTNSKLESESKLAIERERFNAEQINDEVLKLERLKEIALLEQEQEQKRLQAIVDNANAGTQAKVDAQIALDEFMEQSRQANIDADTALTDAKIALNKKEAESEEEMLGAISGALNGLSALAGENAEAQKAIGVAQAIIDTYIGANKAIAQGGIVGTIAAVGVIASGLANVQNILTTKIPKPEPSNVGGGGTRSISSPTPSAAPQAPQFNILGGGATNQLAGLLADQSSQPVKAYVVSNEVSTAQSLDRNIVESATLG
jgi:DNA repair exonuclease SbcCD ATPase subunit